MKYKTIVDTDEFKDFKFFEDEIGPYMVAKDANACADSSGWIPLYFKEVKEESAFDKVRAEIIKESFPEDDKSVSSMVYLKDVLGILDKYKAEINGKQ